MRQRVQHNRRCLTVIVELVHGVTGAMGHTRKGLTTKYLCYLVVIDWLWRHREPGPVMDNYYAD